eukprot:767109-Hanusia_phi.AAC.6
MAVLPDSDRVGRGVHVEHDKADGKFRGLPDGLALCGRTSSFDLQCGSMAQGVASGMRCRRPWENFSYGAMVYGSARLKDGLLQNSWRMSLDFSFQRTTRLVYHLAHRQTEGTDGIADGTKFVKEAG